MTTSKKFSDDPIRNTSRLIGAFAPLGRSHLFEMTIDDKQGELTLKSPETGYALAIGHSEDQRLRYRFIKDSLFGTRGVKERDHPAFDKTGNLAPSEASVDVDQLKDVIRTFSQDIHSPAADSPDPAQAPTRLHGSFVSTCSPVIVMLPDADDDQAPDLTPE